LYGERMEKIGNPENRRREEKGAGNPEERGKEESEESKKGKKRARNRVKRQGKER